MTYYLQSAYCNLPSNPLLGSALIGVLLLTQTLSVILSGVSFFANDLALAFLLIWVYNFEYYIAQALAEQFPSPLPVCSLLEDPDIEAVRPNGFPSWDSLSIFTLSTFVILNQFLTRKPMPLLLWAIMIASPFAVVLSLFSTDNATLNQLWISAVMGIGFGIFWAVRYHYFLKWFLYDAFASSWLKRWFYLGDVFLVEGQSEDDLDITILKNRPTGEGELRPVEGRFSVNRLKI